MTPGPHPGVIETYRAFLPVTAATPAITIGEGTTPLVRAPALERRTGIREVWLKLEGCNPSGSFKDRGMALAVAKAVEAGAHTFICASTGNTAASAAAFGARYRRSVVVVVPRAGTAIGKLSQALIYGAKVLAIDGSFDQGLDAVRVLAQREGVALVNSLNPFRLQGQQTAAFEIVDALGDAPDELYIPVGNAGNITAYWMGFAAYAEAGRAHQKPVLRGFQAAGAAPIVTGSRVVDPQTVASAIRIGNPASWKLAEAARDASGGTIEAVTDAAIVAAYRLLASEAGVFVELASAAAVAGLLQRASAGHPRADRVVCILTGSGLKDPDSAVRLSPAPVGTAPDPNAMAAALGWSA
ncbi:MAG: threonine synthase [Actinobacteria bacterium]|nr:threonine synthase [Actinomycetota bacterium]